MTLALLKSDDVSPATGLTFSANAGAESATQTLHLWYNKTTPGGIIRDVFLQLEVDNGSGTYVTSGVAACDQHWFKARVVSGSNPSNDPSFILETTDWFDLGSNAVLPIPDLVGNSARYIEVKIRAPLGDGAATTVANWRLVPRYNEAAFGVPGGLAELGNGIIDGAGDQTANEWRGPLNGEGAPTLTASGTPDDYVHYGLRTWNRRGVALRGVDDQHQLNQNDSAAAALTAGQAYIVTVSQAGAGAPTFTKGLKAAAASAVAPAAPAGELLIGTVKVRYNAVLTEILTSDITVLCVSGQFMPQQSTGLALTINPGRAILAGAFVRRTSQQTAVLVASADNRVWLSASGGLIVTQSATPPQTGVLLLATATTDGSGVTALVDERKPVLLAPNATFSGRATALPGSGPWTADCSLGDIFTLTPIGSSTLTFVNVRPGQMISVVCLTSGTSSYNVTFDSSAITEDPIRATGTADAKYFQWLFRGMASGKALEVVYSVAMA